MIKIAFYKAPGSIFSRLIRWWTKSKYSHCEIVMPDGRWLGAAPCGQGVCCAPQSERNNDDWDFYVMHTTVSQESAIYRFAAEEIGSGYDYIGILLTQIIPLSLENPWWWFCSEFIVAALQTTNRLEGLVPHETSPEGLYQALTGVSHENC